LIFLSLLHLKKLLTASPQNASYATHIVDFTLFGCDAIKRIQWLLIFLGRRCQSHTTQYEMPKLEYIEPELMEAKKTT